MAALEELDQISAVDCRAHVRRHFDVGRMADDYLAAYEYVAGSNGLTQRPDEALNAAVTARAAGSRDREVLT